MHALARSGGLLGLWTRHLLTQASSSCGGSHEQALWELDPGLALPRFHLHNPLSALEASAGPQRCVSAPRRELLQFALQSDCLASKMLLLTRALPGMLRMLDEGQ